MTDLTRREFFALNVAAAIAAYFPPGIVGASMPLDADDYHTLLMIVRTIFPHEGADDSGYARVIASIAARCRADDGTSRLVRGNLARLDRHVGGCFATAAPQLRINALKKCESQQFFQLLYRDMLRTVYESDDLWAMVAADVRRTQTV